MADRPAGRLPRAALLLVAALVVLVLVLLRPFSSDPEPGDDPGAGTSTAPAPAPVPTVAEWCDGFQGLAGAQGAYAATPDERGAEFLRETADDLLALGVPEEMPIEARGGWFTLLSGVYAEIGVTLDPADVPGAADGEQLAGSDQAFAAYLQEYCPA